MRRVDQGANALVRKRGWVVRGATFAALLLSAAAGRAQTASTEASKFQSQRNSSSPRVALTGTRVTWLQYRGPAKVTFETPVVQVADGKATTTARFSAPGTYTLLATAGDGKLSTRTQVVVAVQ